MLTVLNGHEITPDDQAAIDHAYECGRDRDLQLLAGVLTSDVLPD